VQPFGGGAKPLPSGVASAGELARCTNCFAYINHIVQFNKSGNWCCCLCGTWGKAARYLSPPARGSLPEMKEGLVEIPVEIGGKRK